MALLIERPDDTAPNREAHCPPEILYETDLPPHPFVTGASGEMEVLNRGGRISKGRILSLQKYALGKNIV